MRATLNDPSLQGRLDNDGFVVMDLISSGEVAELKRRYDELGPAPGDPNMACHSSFHSYDTSYKVRASEAVLATLRPHIQARFDRQRMLPANYIVKWPSAMSGFGLHQDLTLVDESQHRSVEVWVALDDTHELNGQLWMVPGSHRWLPQNIRGIQAFPFPFGSVTKRIIDEHAVPVPLKAGQAVVFNHATLHFSLPNKTESPRMVAICDLIPEEAQHLHYFGDGKGQVEVFEIDDSFWTENNPFTLWKAPPRSQCLGTVDGSYYRELTDEDLDQLVDRGVAVRSIVRPRGAMNAAKPWCHRCGSVDVDVDSPNRYIGNVTLLCDACREQEASRAVSPAHVGVPAS